MIKPFNITETANIYHQYMTLDFPKDELKPLFDITTLMQKGLYHTIGLYDDTTLLAYGFLFLSPNIPFCLLDYFAVLKSKRNQGLGHRFCQELRTYLKHFFPYIKGIYIECERPENAINYHEYNIRNRRIAFYLDNQAVLLDIDANLFGVDYNILMLPTEHSCTSSDLTVKSEVHIKTLDMIYQKMFKKRYYAKWVKLCNTNFKSSILCF